MIFFASTPAKKSPPIGELNSWVTTSFNLQKDERKKGERRRRESGEKRRKTIEKGKSSWEGLIGEQVSSLQF
jgi:hypothetical protein